MLKKLVANQELIEKEMDEEKKPTLYYKIVEIISEISLGIITFGGLGLFHSHNDFYANMGMLIWCGTILMYLISGWIFQAITKIHLTLGYGGWTPGYRKKRRR